MPCRPPTLALPSPGASLPRACAAATPSAPTHPGHQSIQIRHRRLPQRGAVGRQQQQGIRVAGRHRLQGSAAAAAGQRLHCQRRLHHHTLCIAAGAVAAVGGCWHGRRLARRGQGLKNGAGHECGQLRRRQPAGRSGEGHSGVRSACWRWPRLTRRHNVARRAMQGCTSELPRRCSPLGSQGTTSCPAPAQHVHVMQRKGEAPAARRAGAHRTFSPGSSA